MAQFEALTFRYTNGKQCYTRLFRRNSKEVWIVSEHQFGTPAGATYQDNWDDTYIQCFETVSGEVYVVRLDTEVPNGACDLFVYEQVGAAPAVGDPLIFAQPYTRRGKE